MDAPDARAAVLMHIENADRQDITPMERAISFQVQAEAKVFATQEAMAEALGVSKGQVAKMIKAAGLLKVPAIGALFSDRSVVPVEQAYKVAALMERGLVRSEGDRADKRKVMLLLTPAGRALYRKAFAEASRRNQRILSALSEQDCLALFRMLDTVAAEGRVMLDEERRRNA